jgi:hypothetical protein
MIRSRTLSILRRRLFRVRQTQSEAQDEAPPYSPARLSSPLWRLSQTLAVVTGCVFAASLAAFAFGRPWHLQERLDKILPDRWFQSLVRSGIAEHADELRAGAAQTIRTRKSRPEGSRQPGHFGLGSTREEVLRVQGKPDQERGDTWRYGASEVYFARGRVVGWRVADSGLLKLR